MTSIDWLIEQLYPAIKLDSKIIKMLILQAKKNYRKELMDSMQRGMEIQQKYNSRKGFRERNNLLNDKTNG
jgi:hypothetical protein